VSRVNPKRVVSNFWKKSVGLIREASSSLVRCERNGKEGERSGSEERRKGRGGCWGLPPRLRREFVGQTDFRSNKRARTDGLQQSIEEIKLARKRSH